MNAYYNEIDPYAAQWLRNLIDAGHIAQGDVDERSIADVRADDLRGYSQCHWFAGIGGWSIALSLAGWPDDRPVWTGSCPCQPFSAAGAGKAFADERHLWPAWFSLIAECGPPSIFGEQVEAAVGWGWLDTVFADLEGEGYAVGASVLPACGLGAPHIRQRLWFVANASGQRRDGEQVRLQQRRSHFDHAQTSGRGGSRSVADTTEPRRSHAREHDGGSPSLSTRSAEHGRIGELANGDSTRRGSRWAGKARSGRDAARIEPTGLCAASELGHADSEREISVGGICEGPHAEHDGTGALGLVDTAGEQVGLPGRARLPRATGGFWSDADWIACTDGKARPVGPGSFPLGHGIQRRASKLRAYGNAIVPQVAAEFISAATEAFIAIVP